MGVQAILGVNEKKDDTAITTPASGAAVFPGGLQVSVVTMLDVDNDHRNLESYNGIMDCINHARDNRLYESAASIAVVKPIGAAKASIREEADVADVVENDVGILIVGTERAKGGRQHFESKMRQALDVLRERGRLGA